MVSSSVSECNEGNNQGNPVMKAGQLLLTFSTLLGIEMYDMSYSFNVSQQMKAASFPIRIFKYLYTHLLLQIETQLLEKKGSQLWL